LADKDRRGAYCVRLFKYFHYRGHLCIVTELLGTSLYHALKNIRPRPDGVCALRMTTLRNVTKQLCAALDFLASVGLIHADLKTENVLLERPDISLEDDNPRVGVLRLSNA
jgi:serine/threonine protein kinase